MNEDPSQISNPTPASRADRARIRTANPSDLADVFTCRELAFGSTGSNKYRQDVRLGGQLEEQVRDGAVHIICDPERILGYVSFAQVFNHLFIESIAILPEHQRKGLGSQLLEFVEGVAIKRDIGSIKLFADEKNTGNIAFYDNRGYQKTGSCEELDFCRVFYSKVVDRLPI